MPALLSRRVRAVLVTASAAALTVSAGATAQGQRAGASDTTLPGGVDPMLRALRWRNVGPWRGGRSVAVAGDPTRPLLYYFGGVDGGVWKTTNGGLTWRNITDRTSDIASVGAIAVAPSDPNVIWVGTGEGELREDLTHGNGVWRSTDAGDTWQHLGLEDTRHIPVVRVDPRDPDVAFVAAMGHAFGPNSTRGLFRTRDGGKTWQKILYIDDATGAIDVAIDPTNPRIVYAAMWRFRRTPWGMDAGGGRSGLWKSLDGGDTWTEITSNPGIPKLPLGRIGVVVSPSNPSRLYASIEAADSAGGIFRSEDAGKTWSRVNADQKFMVRPWYYSRLTADPLDANTVWVMNLSTWRSVDAGKTFTRVRAPHGDDHTLWIDPKDPKRMIEGNDGGATISADAGESWSTQYNQPTAQFYHVVTDNEFPYHIYGAQQDNSSIAIASRSDEGAVTRQDFYDVGGGESGYIAVRPDDPNIVYGSSYMGTITRFDRRTKQTRDISLWHNDWDGTPVSDVPYRFAWTFPIILSPSDPHRLYVTAQKVHVTTDDGQTWQDASPDLTVHDPATMLRSGGLTGDMTGTEWYATIFTFAESPVTAGVLWSGTDDGLVQVSRDGGKTWANITPKGLGKFTKMSMIDASHFDAGTAYLAANRYQQDDFAPYLFKTSDYGKTWTKIVAGIPSSDFTRTIREDPVRRGLLYAGTESGAYASLDDGSSWQRLQLNLPHVSVRDLTVHGADLIAATHGRSFWVLDDVSILRQLVDSVRKAPVFVFAPQPAIRFAGGRAHVEGAGPNPPAGLVLDFYFKQRPTGEVTLTITDSSGAEVQSFSSVRPKPDSTAATVAATQPASPSASPSAPSSASRPGAGSTSAKTGPDSLVKQARPIPADSASLEPEDSVVPTRVGTNRFVWNLRHRSAHSLEGVLNDEGTFAGPVVPPGRYTATLAVEGRRYSRPFTVVNDPRVNTSTADMVAQTALSLRVRDAVDSVSFNVERIESLQQQLTQRVKQTAGQPYASRIKTSVDSLMPKLESLRSELAEVHWHADEISLLTPIKVYNQLLTLNVMVQQADAKPTKGMEDSYADLSRQLSIKLDKLHELEKTDLAALNAMMRELSVPAVLPPPVPSKPARGGLPSVRR